MLIFKETTVATNSDDIHIRKCGNVACRRLSRRRRSKKPPPPLVHTTYSILEYRENLVITTKIENFQLPSAIPHADNHNAPTVMQYCRMLIQ